MAKLFSTSLFCFLLYCIVGSLIVTAENSIFADEDPSITSTVTSTSTSSDVSTVTGPSTPSEPSTTTISDPPSSNDDSTTITTDLPTSGDTSTTVTSTPTTTITSTDESTVTSTQEPTTTPLITETTTTTPLYITQRSFTWDSSEMTDNPIIFYVPEGYFISATVSQVDMDDDNYLLIEGGESHTDESTDGRVFANSVAGPWKYLFKTSAVYAYCYMKDDNMTRKHDFIVEFEQTGEVTTTVPTTTTTELTLPTTQQHDSIYITVNVSGKPLSDYNDDKVVNAFKDCVVILATNYVRVQNMILTQEITREYVIFSDEGISRCPYSWPHSETCVQIKFKVPVFTEDVDLGYQLNTEHLEVMWLRWDQLDEQCFGTHGFSVYSEPDIESSIVWWAVGIGLVIAAFIIVLWFLRNFGAKLKNAIKKGRFSEDSDVMSIISSSRRESVSSLGRHYLQDHVDAKSSEI